MTQELSALRMIEFYPSVMLYIFSCYLFVNTLHYFLIVGIFYTVGKVVYLGPCKNYSVIFLITAGYILFNFRSVCSFSSFLVTVDNFGADEELSLLQQQQQ